DRSDDHAVIAVQGPRSSAIVAASLGDMPARLSYFDFWSARFADAACWVSRIGYSGEFGYELIVRTQDGPALWETLLRTGVSCGLAECGFEAVDSLRIEAGYLLFANELAIPVTPYELGLARLVDMYLIDFIGLSSLRRLRWQEPVKRLVGLLPESGRHVVDLASLAATATENETTTRLTSVCRSPLIKRVLALGFVTAADRYPGTAVSLAGMGPARVARLPFYDPGHHLPRA
ncbi:MAG: glycine cleavage T C-terminal barrel domain-containing protein, partial [Burkholderiales bacterium]